jgi:hypothetical protein
VKIIFFFLFCVLQQILSIFFLFACCVGWVGTKQFMWHVNFARLQNTFKVKNFFCLSDVCLLVTFVSLCLSICLSIYRTSVSVFRMSVCVSICLFICLSIYLTSIYKLFLIFLLGLSPSFSFPFHFLLHAFFLF